MQATDYSTIQSLVSAQDVRGNSVNVTFLCPETGIEVTSSGPLRRLDSFQSQAARTVKKNLWAGLRKTASRAVADTLGKGTAGKIARELTSTGMRQAEKNSAFSQEEIQSGVVAAFESVQASFHWDAPRGAWIGVVRSEGA